MSLIWVRTFYSNLIYSSFIKSVLGHCEGVGLFRTLWQILGIAASESLIVHFLGPFELIDGNGDSNITRDEWQEKIELAMDKVMDVTNFTMAEDYEDLYDNIWEALDCDNGTTITIEVKAWENSFW